MAKTATDPKSMATMLGIKEEQEPTIGEKKIRVNFNVTESEHRKLKMLAAAQGRTIASILRECVQNL